MKRATTRRGQAGYTLMEILVVVAIAAVILIVAYTLVEQAMQTSLFVESHNQLAALSQRPVNLMLTDVYQNHVIFQNDTIGNAYRDKVIAQLTTALPIAPDYQLPLMDATSTTIVPDTSTYFTGNCLLVLRQLPPLLIPWDHDNNSLTANVNFPADVYRFDFFYLSRNTSRKFSTAGYYLDLIEWKSVPFADYQQLNNLFGGLTSAQKTQIINGLSARSITIAMDPSGTVAPTSAFFTIQSAGTFAAVANPTITRAAASSLLPEFGGGSISGKMIYSVGFRPTATTTFPVRDPIPRFAAVDSSRANYCSGLEVKFIGAGVSLKGAIRLVVLASYGVTKMDSEEGFAVAAGG